MPRALNTSTLPWPQAQRLPFGLRAMGWAARALQVLAVAVLMLALLRWAMVRPSFDLREVRLQTPLQRQSLASLQAHLGAQARGGFFTLNVQQWREVLERQPWVRRAEVRRVWPATLELRLEEHEPVARWRALPSSTASADAPAEPGHESSTDADDAEPPSAWVNRQGEVFEAPATEAQDEALPEFSGPSGSEAQVLAAFHALQPVLAPLGSSLTALHLSPRGSWRAEMESGAKLELGRGSLSEVQARTQTFVQTLPQVIGARARTLLAADLRHPQGYAVRLAGVGVQSS